MRGKFITLEGIDGAGKSSHLEFIAAHAGKRGAEVVTSRDPGGTPLSEKLRDILLNDKMHGDTEALLMFASRRERLVQLIEPALERGAWVISDRFSDSTYAYQCGGRGVPESRIAILEEWVHGHLQPDLTFLFDAPVEIARERLDRGTPDPDKFEREQADFFSRVRHAYLERAARYPGRIKVVNSARPLSDIQSELAALMDAL